MFCNSVKYISIAVAILVIELNILDSSQNFVQLEIPQDQQSQPITRAEIK